MISFACAVVTVRVKPVESEQVAAHVPVPAPEVSGTRVVGVAPRPEAGAAPVVPALGSRALEETCGFEGLPEGEIEI